MPVERPQEDVGKTTNPETLLALKNEILTAWDQLPPEHQATMALTLVQDVQTGEWGDWLSGATSILTRKEPETEEQTFPVYSLTRTNMENAFSEEEISQLGDKDIQKIAQEMSDGFPFDDGFWFAVKTVGERILEGEDETPGSNSE